MGKKFIDSGKRYRLMVDWEGRLKREIPFLLRVFKRRGISSGKIIDVGCGPGLHARELAGKGYKLTALDLKADMTAEIKNEKIEIICGDFLDKKKLKKKKFKAAYSLGNSVALMACRHGYEKIIKRFSEIISPGGILIFQTLNFEKERNSWSRPRPVSVKDGELIFIRNFTTKTRYVTPLIITLFRKKGEEEWDMEVSDPPQIPRISSLEMRSLIKKYGFKDICLYGSYQEESFKSRKSVDMLWTALKG